MKKVLFGLLMLSAGYAFGSEVQTAVNQVLQTAAKMDVEDLAFARLYYSLHTNRAIDYGLTSKKYDYWNGLFQTWYNSKANSSEELRAFWKELNKIDSLELRKSYGFTFNYFEKEVYKALFDALSKKGKVELKYGPLAGTEVKNSDIEV